MADPKKQPKRLPETQRTFELPMENSLGLQLEKKGRTSGEAASQGPVVRPQSTEPALVSRLIDCIKKI
jgi:hypothetical protein